MAAALKLKAISATDTKERRGRRPLHLCRKLAKPRGKVKQLALVDKRTTFGRLITSFKRDLVLRFVERYGREPDALDETLIQSCCTIRANLIPLEQKILEEGLNAYERTSFASLSNTFRLQLGLLLDYPMEVEAMRQNAEARLVKAYDR